MSKQLSYKRTIPAEPEDVFYAFTTAQGWRDWCCDAALMRSQPGGSYHLSWDDGWYTSGSILEKEAPRLLRLSWNGKDDPGPTEVRVRLGESSGSTELTIEHTGFGEGATWDSAHDDVDRGWQNAIDNLESIFTTGADLRVTQRPMLGIMGSDFNAEIAEKIGVPVTEGARLQDAIEGMGAAKAGLQGGDVIVELDGKPLRDWTDFSPALSGRRAGEEIEVTYYRGEEKNTVTMPLTARPIPETPLDPKEFAAELSTVYAEVMSELRKGLADVSEGDAEWAPDGEWTAKENLAHLIAGEESYARLVTYLIQDSEPQYPDSGANSNEQVRAIVRTTPTLEALLDRLERAQAETIAVFEQAEALENRKGAMWRMGLWSLHFPGDHEREHLGQIQRTLAQMPEREPA